PARTLDGHLHLRGRCEPAEIPAQPRQSIGCVRHLAPPAYAAHLVDYADRVLTRGPVDTDEPFHLAPPGSSLPCAGGLGRSLTVRRSGLQLPWRYILWALEAPRPLRRDGSHAGRRAASDRGPL